MIEIKNDENGMYKKLSLLKKVPKIHFLGQKSHFLGLGKRKGPYGVKLNQI